MSVTASRTAPSFNDDRHYLFDLPDQLDLYDKSICGWLSQMRFDYAPREEKPDIKPLRVVKSSPERAFADIRRDKSFSKDVKDFERKQEQIPLPIATFTRSDLTVDMTRFKSVTNTRKVGFLRSDKDERFTWRFPLPYNFTYQVDFWTRMESTLDRIRVWAALRFVGGSYFLLPVDLREVSRHYSIQNVFTQFGGISDTSDLEPGSEQRLERATMTLDVQGWIFFPVEIVKTVICGQIDILDVPLTVPFQDPDDPDKLNAAACDDAFIIESAPFDAS